MLFFVFLVSADSYLLPIRSTYVPIAEWRDSLMRMFYENISKEGMHSLKDDPISDYCDGVRGITCERKEVRSVRYHSFKHGNFNISALPHTTVSIDINSCQQNFVIETRSFPRRLQRISVALNKIRGRIDLSALPETLETGEFHWNEITGPISLEKLPPKLRKINLMANKISQRTVYYDNLPETISNIFLVYKWENNRIKEIRAINPDNAVQDENMFGEMKKGRVH